MVQNITGWTNDGMTKEGLRSDIYDRFVIPRAVFGSQFSERVYTYSHLLVATRPEQPRQYSNPTNGIGLH